MPTTTLALIAVIAILAAAYVASPVLAPLALGLFIIALVWPLQAHLQARMPKLLALAIAMLHHRGDVSGARIARPVGLRPRRAGARERRGTVSASL